MSVHYISSLKLNRKCCYLRGIYCIYNLQHGRNHRCTKDAILLKCHKKWFLNVLNVVLKHSAFTRFTGLSGKSTCLVVHFVHFWWISRSIFASPPKIVHHLLVRCSKIFQRCHKNLYHLVMTNIAMENPKKISGGLANAGKIIYFD